MATEINKTLNDLYRTVSSIPGVVSGKITSIKEGSNKVHVGFNYTLSQRDFTRKTTRSYLYKDSVSIVDDGLTYEDLNGDHFPTEFSCVKESISSCGVFKVALRHIDVDNKGKPSRFIEIYKRGVMVQNLDVSTIHQEFYGDSTFGCLDFSKDGQKVVYIAERNIDSTKKEDTCKTKSLVVDDESELYDFNQEWGETFINRKRPNLFIIHLDQLFDNNLEELRSTFDYKVEDIVKPIDLETDKNTGESIDPGQARFSKKNHQTLFFTGYNKSPRKHGIVYCNNRPAFIYSVDIDGKNLQKISNQEFSARNPEFLLPSQEKYLFYLQSSMGGAHASSSRLIKMDLETNTEHVLIEKVKEHEDKRSFPGLFPDSLPSTPIKINDQNYIAIASQWRSRKVLLGINIDQNQCQNQQISILTESLEEKGAAWSYLDTKHNYLLASRSSPHLPSELMFGQGYINDSNQLSVRWVSIKKWGYDLKINQMKINQIDWEVFDFPERDNRLECILIKALSPHKQMEKPSLLINIHGGPHSGNIETFSFMNTILCLLGFEILHVNYSGSTGYGDDYIHELIGQIGDLDVKDCQYAMEQVWNKGNYHRKFVTGGSHGGFLTAHLIGQYPDYYSGCALRNPVTNVGSMTFTTDIPDWCFEEAGIPYQFNQLAITTPEKYEIMFKASPEQYVNQIVTPILLLLGIEDRRVPISQGIQWYNHIRARQPDLIKIKLIPNVGHPLDSIEAESISITQIAKHFLNLI